LKKDRYNIAFTLLERGANANLANNEGASPLYIASKEGNVNVARMLLNYGADVNTEGASPLSIAYMQGHVDIVQLLLDGGADVDFGVDAGRTLLFEACERGDVDVVRHLLDDADSSDNNGATALRVACESGRMGAVRLLIEYEATINQADDDGNSPLYYACRKDDNMDVVKFLCENGATKRTERASRRSRPPASMDSSSSLAP